MTRSSTVPRWGMVLFTTIGVGAFAAPAQAASTGVVRAPSSTQVEYRAATGTANTVTITRSGRTVTVDDKVKIKAGKGCKAVKGDKTKVRCKLPKTPTQIKVKLGDKNDKLTNRTGIRVQAEGGSGNDTLTGGSGIDVLLGDGGTDKLYGRGGNDVLGGGSGADRLHGEAGDDRLSGDDGNDKLYGGAGRDHLYGDYFSAAIGNDALYGEAGNDFLIGDGGNDLVSGGSGNDTLYGDGDEGNPRGVGADVISGGSGVDTLAFYYGHGPVTVDLDGASRDDGRAGEHDSAGADLENIVGPDSASTLIGNASANRISGGESGDVIRGAGGNDDLDGGYGPDRLYGDAGDDTLKGIDPEQPATTADTVDGGANTDTCRVDALDVVTNCEK